MTKTALNQLGGFKPWLDAGDIFYSKQDKLEFLSALNAVVNENLGLIITSDVPSLLDYYSRLLVSRLRKIKGISMDVFFPATTDGLLSRFNDILEHMSLDEAKEQPATGMSPNLMVVHDANSIANEQWLLLARLMADFPGVNLRLILFLDDRQGEDYDRIISLLGKDLHRWIASAPTQEQARDLLRSAKESGYLRETSSLLKSINLTTELESEQTDAQRSPTDLSVGLTADRVENVASENAKLKDLDTATLGKHRSKNTHRTLIFVGACITIGLLVAAIMADTNSILDIVSTVQQNMKSLI